MNTLLITFAVVANCQFQQFYRQLGDRVADKFTRQIGDLRLINERNVGHELAIMMDNTNFGYGIRGNKVINSFTGHTKPFAPKISQSFAVGSATVSKEASNLLSMTPDALARVKNLTKNRLTKQLNLQQSKNHRRFQNLRQRMFARHHQIRH